MGDRASMSLRRRSQGVIWMRGSSSPTPSAPVALYCVRSDPQRRRGLVRLAAATPCECDERVLALAVSWTATVAVRPVGRRASKPVSHPDVEAPGVQRSRARMKNHPPVGPVPTRPTAGEGDGA